MSTRRSTPKPHSSVTPPDRPDLDPDWRIDELTRRRALTGIALARAALDEARRANALARGEAEAAAVSTAA